MNQQETINIIAFHNSGGSPMMFGPWNRFLPDHFKILPIELPGHGSSLGEPCYSQMAELIPALLPQVKAKLKDPCVFLGHSLGSLVMFEVAHALRKEGGVLPQSFFIVASSAPQANNYHLPFSDDPSRLTVDEVLDQLMPRLDEQTQRLLNESHLRTIVGASYKADFTLARSGYQYQGRPPLDIPITVVAYEDDTWVSLANVAAWQEQTRAAFKLIKRPGEHFQIYRDVSALVDLLVTSCS